MKVQIEWRPGGEGHDARPWAWPPLGTEAFQEGTLEEEESERHP